MVEVRRDARKRDGNEKGSLRDCPKAFDIGQRNPNGNLDIPCMREGGLDALFFSIWVPSEVTGPTAVKRALDQIDAVREAVRTHPHDLMLAATAADVRKAAADHKIAALIGVEGGHWSGGFNPCQRLIHAACCSPRHPTSLDPMSAAGQM